MSKVQDRDSFSDRNDQVAAGESWFTRRSRTRSEDADARDSSWRRPEITQSLMRCDVTSERDDFCRKLFSVFMLSPKSYLSVPRQK